MNTATRQSSNRNASLEKAHRLLLAFSDATPELGVMELARRVGLNKSTVSRFVATLTQVGLLERVEGSKKVRLGVKVFELGSLARRHHPISVNAMPVIERLSGQLRATVSLGVALDGDLLVLGRSETTMGSAGPVPGQRYSLERTAAGRVLLAHGDAAEINGHAVGAAQDRSVLQSDGVLTVQDDFAPGVGSIAAPVFDRTGMAVGALVVSDQTRRIAGAAAALSQPLRRSAAELSRRLGFHRAVPVQAMPAEASRRAESA